MESWKVSPLPESVSAARHRVLDTVRQWKLNLPGPETEALELLTSELVTNGCRHASSEMTLTVSASSDEDGTMRRVQVTVEDNSPVEPAVLQAGDDEECGRGMLLVRHLASSWGVRPVDGGKQVWFALDLPSSAPVRHATPRMDTLWNTVSPHTPQPAVRSRHRRQVAHA